MSRSEEKKKVLIATPEFPPDDWGGLAATAKRVSEHVRDMGLEVHVAVLRVANSPLVLLDENRWTEVIDGITVHGITVGRERVDSTRDLWECPHTLTLRMMYQSLEMLHQQENFHLFHSFFLYPVGYITGLLGRRFDVPSVATIVGNDIKKYIFSPEKVGACLAGLKNADRVVALSRDLLEMAHGLTSIVSKARVIHNSVEIPDQAWRPDRAGERPFRIGCAAIFKYAKGLPYLFKAVAALRPRGVELELVGVLRQSETEMYDHMVRETGIEDLLRFQDPIPHDRISRWLRTLDAFVLPSVSEGCPNILMEAMATGVPCVATRTGAAEDLMQDRVSGLLVPWGDSQSLAHAIAEIIDNPKWAATMGSEAGKRVQSFSPQREFKAWNTLYAQLLDS